MKNFKRIIAVMTALTVMLSLTLSFNVSFASAAEFTDVKESDSYATAVGLLSSLGVIVGYENGSFRPDNTITRAEAATIMVRAVGRETQAENSAGSTKYSDVPAKHWASGYINVASDMGIIVGYPDGTFHPEENVTYEQIVKMIVCAIGHDVRAQQNGGYPMGYLTAASSAGVTKGVGGSVGQAASRATVARLIYNSLEVEMMDATAISTGTAGITYGLNGKTILNDYLGLEKVDAVVAKTYLSGDTYSKKNKDVTLDITKVYGSSDHVNKAAYEKGESYVFTVGDTDAAIYLGYSVTAYVGEDEDTGKNTVFAVTLNGTKNSTVEVAASKLNADKSSDILISYARKSTDKKYTELELESSNGGKPRYTLVINDRISDELISDYFDNLDLITLVDNDNDNVYEFAFVSVFTSNGCEFVVTDIDEDDGEYFFDGDGDSFDADTTDSDVLYTVIRDGKVADFDDISIGDVITVLDDSSSIITVYVSSKSVTGAVSEYDEDDESYTIKNTSYTLSPAFSDKLEVGDSGTFYINYLGKIADSTVSSTVASGDYVFITNYDTTTSWNKTSYVIQAVTATGAVKAYTIKNNKVKFVNTKGKVYKNLDAEDVYKYLLDASNDLSDKYNVQGYAGVAKVKVSSNDTVSEIYLPGTYSDFYAQTKYASDNAREYSAKKGTYGSYNLTGKIVAFNIDKSEKDLVDAIEVGSVKDFFSDGDSYNFIAYGEKSDDIEAVMITDGIASVDYEQHATIITKITQVTSNGEKTIRYTGITNGVSKTYTVDPDESYDVEKGNIVLIEVGGDGYISSLELVAATTTDSDDLDSALSYGDIPTDDDADVYAGLVTDKGSKTFRIEDVEDYFYNDSDTSYTLIDYTLREATFEKANFSAIKTNSSTESFVVVRTYEDTVIDVFIFRMKAGTYGGATSNIWDNINSVEDEEDTAAPTEETTAPTEETTAAPTEETTTAPTEETTAAPTEETTAAPTEETTAAPTDETTAASEDETVSLSVATEAPTEATTAPTEATTAPTEATAAPTEATTAPTEATTAPTEATTAPTEATTAPTEATTAPTEATTAPTEATTAPTEATTAPTEATTAPTEEPSEQPVEPATEAPTEVPAKPVAEEATTPTDATAATEAATAPTEASTSAVKTNSTLAKAVLDLVNAERAKVGLTALKWNDKLAKVSENYSIEMATYSNFSHTGKFGSTLVSRMAAGGITYTAAGENIAWNQKTAEKVVEAWMNSEGHRANILSAKYTEMGVGLAIAADGSYYWTQNFIG